ncbi:tyrosine-type recombinase/integrase [Mesorhizobium sp. ZC-5]|uniref:tyrosine-type recombinase/integrase n=1 Tax=Mesorhizobium sp. ZC-5 TaxID=2986066 RepID=UPI0021E7CA5A|nr:site-specific integrase [Mesorhizobium sp. ZC-5]MCV3240637.1 integrase arm-type DNA-binding domain-containing protein [Mesorhizobium sp. ZC-5]
MKALKPPADGRRYEVMDSVVPGFGVRVSAKGKRTFILIARYPPRKHPSRREIGVYGKMTLDQARDTARNWAQLVQQGVDPNEKNEADQRKDSHRRENTFELVLEDYIEKAVEGPNKLEPKLRTAKEVKRILYSEYCNDRVVGKTTRKGLGPKPISDVSRKDIQTVIDDAIARGSAGAAHQILGMVRAMINWAIDQGKYGIESSPCDRMKPKRIIGPKLKRSRFHSDEEIKVIWEAVQLLGYPYGPLLLLLILLGRRRAEVANARWREFDLENKLWHVPGKRMKGQIPDVVPLTDTAISILQSLPRFSGENTGDFIFSTTFGKKPVNGFGKIKVRLDEIVRRMLSDTARVVGQEHTATSHAIPVARSACLSPSITEMDHFVLHDFRRTIRTHLPRLGVDRDVAELILAHKKTGIQSVYDIYEYLAEKRNALNRWDAHLRELGLSFRAGVVWTYARKPRWLKQIGSEAA